MPGLFASPPQISPSGVLSFTPAAGAEGTAVIPVRLADDGGTANGGVATSGPVSLTVAVDAVDASPTISLLRRLRSADGRGTLSLLVGDDGPTADLDLTGTASRDGVRLLLDGDGADRRVVFSGLPAGTRTFVTLRVSDSATSTALRLRIARGTSGTDTLHGTDGVDVLLGRNGDDRVTGRLGSRPALRRPGRRRRPRWPRSRPLARRTGAGPPGRRPGPGPAGRRARPGRGSPARPTAVRRRLTGRQ